jgi:adenosylhomocysteinase
VIAVNDAKCKFLFDNRYVPAICLGCDMRTTNLYTLDGCIAGYGGCGKGVALRQKAWEQVIIVKQIRSEPMKPGWTDISKTVD